MPSVFFVLLTALAGALLGCLLGTFLMFFVYEHLISMFYVGSTAVGALLGAAYGLYSLRRHRAPPA